jgi:hypothetical protein
VAGGFDGTSLLSSVERHDAARPGKWSATLTLFGAPFWLRAQVGTEVGLFDNPGGRAQRARN